MKKLIFYLCLILNVSLGFAQESQVKFKAVIENSSKQLYVKNNQGKVVKEIVSKGKGLFKSSFNVEKGIYILDDGSEYTMIYLENGFDLNLKMDAKLFDESIVYTGNGSNENNYLAQKSLTNEEYWNAMNAVKNQQDLDNLISKFKNTLKNRLDSNRYTSNFLVEANKLMESESQEMINAYESNLKKQKLNGAAAPQFDYVNFDGTKTKLSDLKGKYVYIDVWATWCGPCRAEIPFLKKAEEKFHGKNIEFVSISADVAKDFEKWKTFVKEKALGGIQLFADNDWNSAFLKSFNINSIPRFILIDPNGKVVSADELRPSDTKLSEKLDLLLK
jgi:thiol-disulfide isomerase/thioredoxin